MNPDWLESYPRLTESLLDIGWLVPPFMIGRDFDQLKRFCDSRLATLPDSEREKVEIEQDLDGLLSPVVFHPGYRAFYVHRSLELDHLSDFSHLYEQAVLCYYKREYSAAVLTLLPVVEGVLLSISGWKFGDDRKPKVSKLIQRIRESRLEKYGRPIVAAFEMYRDSIVSFLERWVYRDTSVADFGLSFLNRHFVLHGMAPATFFRPADVHRLLLFFDLVMEYLSLLQHIHYTFIPEDKVELNLRRAYYSQLAEGSIGVRQAKEMEVEFLSQHTNYQRFEREPSWAQQQMQGAIEMLEMMAMIAAAKKRERE